MSKRALAKQQAQQAAAAAEAAAAEQKRNTQLANAEKFMQLDEIAMRNAFDTYRGVLDNLHKESYFKDVKMITDKIFVAWGSWDKTHLTTLQQATLYRQYVTNLPQGIKKALADQKKQYAYERSSRDWLRDTYQNIAQVLVDQAAPQQPLQLTTDNSSTMVFPTMRHIDDNVSHQLEVLADLWSMAQSAVTTVEDKFFLDQIVATYLPDMWRMYQPFIIAESEIQLQAANLVAEQVILLQHGVNGILAKNRDISLGELKAHKNFLAQRLEQDPAPFPATALERSHA